MHHRGDESFNLRHVMQSMSRKATRMIIAAACLAVGALNASAQSAFDTIGLHLNDAGFQPGRATAGAVAPPAAFSGVERPDTASFLMSERLLSLPGRGLDLEVDLHYDSSLYQLDSDGIHQSVRHTRVGPQWPAYGFRMGYGTLIYQSVMSQNCSSQVIPAITYCPISPPRPHAPAGGATFVDASGGRHRIEDGISVDSTDLRLSAEGGLPTITYADGTTLYFGQSEGRYLYSLTAEAYCPDNGIMRTTCNVLDFMYYPTVIKDRNGNFIRINYGTGGQITSIVDTLGRTINFQYDADGHLRVIKVPGFGSGPEREVVNFHYRFLQRAHSFSGQGNTTEQVKVITAIYYPGTKSGKRFSYSSYGMIYKVEKLLDMDVDAGGNISGQVVASTEYNYPLTPANLLFQLPKYTTRTDRWIETTLNQVREAVHTFEVQYINNGMTPTYANLISVSTVTAPDQTTVSQTTKRWYPPPFHSVKWDDTWDEGLILEEVISRGRPSLGGKVFSKVRYGWEKKPGGPRLWDQLVTDDAGQNRYITYRYQPDPAKVNFRWKGIFTNLREVKEFDFDGVTELRRTEYAYETRPEWADRWLMKLPTRVKVFAGGSAVPLSQVDYLYDTSALTSYSDVPMYETSTPQYRGNLTSISRNTNAAAPAEGQVVTETMSYDIVGNVVDQTDPIGNSTPAPDDRVTRTEYSADYARAYPTHLISPLPDPDGNNDPSTSLTSDTAYDFNTGLTTSTTDANGRSTLYKYYGTEPGELPGAPHRLRKVEQPDGGWTAYVYSDEPGNSFTHTQTAVEDGVTAETRQYNDGKGRTTRAFSKSGGGADGWTVIDTVYGDMDRIEKLSNPYFVSLPGNFADAANIDWTSTTYDTLGRKTQTTTPDGAQVNIAYDGTRVLAEDQSKRKRLSRSDALGRLTDVWEISAANEETVNVTFPDAPDVTAGYHTKYTYDVLGNLRMVEQGVQRRFYAYDSLSRLIRQMEPEHDANGNLSLTASLLSPLSNGNNNWSVSYEYDLDGNLKSKTDARGVSITNSYDDLNRVTFRNYSDATPDVTYAYDAPGVLYSKGRLTSVSSSASAYKYLAFDPLGRVTESAQILSVPGAAGQPTLQTYTMAYNYNLAGGMKSQRYPSGKIVATEYDAAGRIAGVKNAAGGEFYAGGAGDDPAGRIQYAAHGEISALKFGNGLWEHADYNTRLQLRRLGLGTSITDSSKLQLDYGYGGLENNGTLLSQVITVGGSAFSLTYRYDAQNRLDLARETRAGGGQTWQQCFVYDRYGNRTFNSGETSDEVEGPAFTVSKQSNRVTTAGYRYDAAGNLECEPARPCRPDSSPYYEYDAENRLVANDRGGNPNVATVFSYDGDGRRVKKVGANGKTTVFVYNATGQLVAEYSSQSFANGISYIMPDHQGSTRVVTGQLGNVVSRHDFLPFGEEITATMLPNSGRQTIPEYNTGSIRQKFTGYERDDETGLDFAQARMYASMSGRFTTPDRPLNDQFGSDPQSWNLYSYVRNNPLNMIDPTGTIGDYYDRYGQWLFTDFQNDDKVYLVDETTTADGTTSYVNVQDLTKDFGILHSQFRNMAATVLGESSAHRLEVSEELQYEMAGIATVHQTNKIAYGANSDLAKLYKNTPVQEQTGKMGLANWAVINAVTGGPDYSNGADMWDGAEQSLFPTSETRDHIVTRGGSRWELHMNTMGWDIHTQDYNKWQRAVGSGFQAPQTRVATVGVNQGKIRLYSTAVWGRTIFWKVR